MEYLTPPAVAALIAGAFSIVAIVVSSVVTYRASVRREALEKELTTEKQRFEKLLSEQKHQFEKELSNQKHQFEIESFERKQRFEPPSIRAVEAIAMKLFEEYPRRLRTFSVFTARIPTYSENELRQILVGMGAQQRTFQGQEAYQLLSPRQEKEQQSKV